MSYWTRRLAAGLGIAFVMYSSACAYMWSTQLAHVFEPSPVLQTTPDRMGMKYDALRIPSGHGAEQGELDAWWIPAAQTTAPTVLFFHGNAQNIGNNLEHVQRLHLLGYNVLIADYRGYGRSTGGQPSESKVYEDAEAVWRYLITQKAVPPGQTFIYGHSLGGAIAIELAAHHPEAAGLITESTFTSMQAMGELNYRYLPIGLLLSQRFASLQKIPELKLPALFIHGTWDKKVPVAMASELYAVAPKPATLLLIEGGEHSNSAAVGWVEYSAALSAFIKQNAR